MKSHKATPNGKSVLVQVHEDSPLINVLKECGTETPAELNRVELSTRESRLVLEALGIAIAHQRRALEVCKRSRATRDLMRAAEAREKQILEFENLKNRVMALLGERGRSRLHKVNADNETTNSMPKVSNTCPS
jgi:hypothetical protein